MNFAREPVHHIEGELAASLHLFFDNVQRDGIDFCIGNCSVERAGLVIASQEENHREHGWRFYNMEDLFISLVVNVVYLYDATFDDIQIGWRVAFVKDNLPLGIVSQFCVRHDG